MSSFDLDFEDEVLATCMRNKTYLRKAISVVEAHTFGTEHRIWLWKTVSDVWETSGELLTRKVALHRARSDFKDDEERIAVVELVGKLKSLRPKSPHAALHELGKFVRFAKAGSAFERSVGLLEKGDVDEAYRLMDLLVQSDRREDDKWEVSRWIEEFTARLVHQKNIKLNPHLYPAVATGIRGLDKLIDGLRPTELGIVASTTNRGKSIFAVQLGYWAINQGIGVVDFRTEMSAAQTAMRYDSRWTRILHSKFKHFEFRRKEIRVLDERLKKAKKKYKGLLRIVGMPVTTATLAKLKRAVTELRDDMRNVGLIIVDSGDHVRPEQSSSRDFRFETAEVYWGLAGWAATDRLPIWAMAQLSAKAVDRVGQTEDIAEAYDKGRIADILATLNQPTEKNRSTSKLMVGEGSVEDEKMVQARIKQSGDSTDLELNLAKHRDGVAKVIIPLETDLRRMLIQDRDTA